MRKFELTLTDRSAAELGDEIPALLYDRDMIMHPQSWREIGPADGDDGEDEPSSPTE